MSNGAENLTVAEAAGALRSLTESADERDMASTRDRLRQAARSAIDSDPNRADLAAALADALAFTDEPLLGSDRLAALIEASAVLEKKELPEDDEFRVLARLDDLGFERDPA